MQSHAYEIAKVLLNLHNCSCNWNMADKISHLQKSLWHFFEIFNISPFWKNSGGGYFLSSLMISCGFVVAICVVVVNFPQQTVEKCILWAPHQLAGTVFWKLLCVSVSFNFARQVKELRRKEGRKGGVFLPFLSGAIFSLMFTPLFFLQNHPEPQYYNRNKARAAISRYKKLPKS
jgi:hypothetical protein